MSASPITLRQAIAAAASGSGRSLHGFSASADIDQAAAGSRLPEAGNLRGKAVLIRTDSQLAAALAMIDLDGLAGRLILAPPDLENDALQGVIAAAEVSAVVSDAPTPPMALPSGVSWLTLAASPAPRPPTPAIGTQWLLFTSGTTGAPKMVAHTLAGLTGAIRPVATEAPVVWGTFYDIRRYGGLQMLLRALSGGGSMVLSDAGEPIAAFLERLGERDVTHLAGTPSHWRKALMSPQIARVRPRYIRLSGEIADQAVLNSLKAAFPGIPIAHAYASTEAGVGFEVDDGLEGFPAAFLGQRGDVEMTVRDGALLLRSPRTATGYVGPGGSLTDAEGFVDTGDMVERRGERFHFVGRANGVINVGGLKVHPEEVEALINAQPGVRMSRVKARKNPITGAIVVAEVLPIDPDAAGPSLMADILKACRASLAAHKAPVALAFVDSLPIGPGGKLERRHA